MPTRYLSILANQNPFPVVVDENSRTIFSVNFRATAASPVDSFEEEIAKLISDAGLGTLNSDMFIGPKSVIPTGNGPYITIIDTVGGFAPSETHNGDKYRHMFVQIQVRAADYLAARTRVVAIFELLDGQRNITVAA